VFESISKCVPSALSYLDISDNKLDESTVSLVNWVCSGTSPLKTLKLANTSFQPKDIPALAQAKSLENLDLSNRKIGKKNDLPFIVQFAQAATALKELSLENSNFPIADDSKGVFTGQFDVKFCSNSLGLNGIQMLRNTHLLDSIRVLNLDDADLTDEGVGCLAECLVGHRTLVHLSIGRDFKGSENSKTRIAAVQSLARVISAEGVLQVLHLPASPTNSSTQLKSHMTTLLAAISENKTLIELDIRHHHMMNQGAVALAKALVYNYTLSTILWDGNSTGTLGFANIKNSLKRNLAVRYMPTPISDIVQIHKDDRILPPEKQKLEVLVTKIQTHLHRNQQL